MKNKQQKIDDAYGEYMPLTAGEALAILRIRGVVISLRMSGRLDTGHIRGELTHYEYRILDRHAEGIRQIFMKKVHDGHGA